MIGDRDGPAHRRASRNSRPTVQTLEGRTLLAASPVGVPGLTLAPVPLVATASATTGLVGVATLNDFQPNSSAVSLTYRAVIAWGDGTYSDGVVTSGIPTPIGGFTQVTGTVSGAHNYNLPGQYTIAVAIVRGTLAASTTEAVSVTGTAIPGSGVLGVAPLSATTRGTTGLVPVAAFVDLVPGSIPPSGQYTTSIAWGDRLKRSDGDN